MCLLNGILCPQMVFFKSLCRPESLHNWLDDAGGTTVDLEQDAANIVARFDKDILKTIKVTIHQHTATGETQRDDEEEKVEVCGGPFKLDLVIGSIVIS